MVSERTHGVTSPSCVDQPLVEALLGTIECDESERACSVVLDMPRGCEILVSNNLSKVLPEMFSSA